MDLRNKCGVWFLVLSLLSSGLTAQTFGEFFNQKKTQKRYLLQQIAALQLYLGYAQKGYELAGSGLGLVRDIRNGEFSLHQAFISSLKRVSPLIGNHTKVREIIACQLGIIRVFSGIRDKERLPVSSRQYVSEVKNHLFEQCLKDLGELLLVVSSGKVEMNEAQRLERLEKIYSALVDKYAFARDFVLQVEGLISGRIKEQEAMGDLRKLYEKE